MPQFTFTLDLPPGINTNDTQFLAGRQWTDGDHVRFFQGRPQNIGGWTGGSTAAIDLHPRCSAILVFNRGDHVIYAFGSDSALKLAGVEDRGTGNPIATVDYSPVGLSSGHKWCLASWGSTLLASIIGGPLYEQIGLAAAAEVMQAPDRISYMLVTPQRQVMCFGCNEEASGDFNGLCIRWSDIEDYTDFTTTATNNAGEHILDGSGEIVAAQIIGRDIAIWTTTSLYYAEYTGDPGQTFRFSRIADECGLAGPKAVTILGGVAYWLTPTVIFKAWVPGALPQSVPCTVESKGSGGTTATKPSLKGLTAQGAQKVVAGNVSKFDEVWFFLPDIGTNGTGDADQVKYYVAYSVGESARAGRPVWFRGTFGRSAWVDSGVFTLASSDISEAPSILAVEPVEGRIYEHEEDAVSSMDWFITSGNIYMDDGRRRVMAQRVTFDFESMSGTLATGAIDMTLLVRSDPHSAPTTKGPYALVWSLGANRTVKHDFRASGRLISVRLARGTTHSGATLRLGKPLFDVVPMGER